MKERELFLAALDIADPAARQAHLQAECADDTELRARVESLLASHEGQSQFLNTPVVEQIADVADAVSTDTVSLETSKTQKGDSDATAVLSDGQTRTTIHLDTSNDEISLGYLQPSSKPGSLGRLAHYEVLEVIGHGAFGTVLRALDEHLQRVVAIKVMATELATTSPARRLFLREAQAAAAIRHENVVSIHAVDATPYPYLVMEYVPGETLQYRLDERGPLDLTSVLRLGIQIAEGLAAAHAQDLIHRDIKPQNILLETGMRDRVKITDFGLARAVDDASLTQSGTIAGTPMYMAPEQALGQKLDQRADLFSFGSVLYQMVSGRPPFRAPSTLAVLKRLAEDTPRPIREIIPETPQWLCDIITKLHAKNPDERYQSAREIADVLADCESQLKAHSGLKDFSLIPRAKAQPAGRWKWVAVWAVMFLLLAYGLYAFNRPAAQPEVAENGTTQPTTTDPIKPDGVPSPVLIVKPPPPPAIVTFDGAQASAHQEAWARYLGLEVEKTIALSDGTTVTFVFIPPGEFLMGSTKEEQDRFLAQVEGTGRNYADFKAQIASEGPQHRVRITQPFYLGKYEVTQGQWQALTGNNPSLAKDELLYPIVQVSWESIQPVLAQLNESGVLEGHKAVLPTEAQWEYACRAGTTTYWHSGNDENSMKEYAWCIENSQTALNQVGRLKPNGYGLYDMHGNVWELCADWYATDFYASSPLDDPTGPPTGSLHVHRGGARGLRALHSRSASRRPSGRIVNPTGQGFRLALTIDAPQR